jgi:branched-chain amino acid transport system permease protein
MAYWIEQILNGLGLVGPIMLVAVSLTVVLQAVRVLNVAIGATILIAALAGLALSHTFGAVGMVVGCVLASTGILVLQEVAVLAPQRSRVENVELASFAATLGVSIVLVAVAALLTNYQTETVPTGLLNIVKVYNVAGVQITLLPMIIFVIAVFMTAAWSLFEAFTSTGKLFRALASNRELALATGIRTRRIALQSALISGALTGVAAFLILLQSRAVDTQSAAGYLITPFVAVVLGGLGDIRGTIIAALFLGVAQSVTGALISSPSLNQAVIFGILFVVLLIRPSGLAAQVSTVRDY